MRRAAARLLFLVAAFCVALAGGVPPAGPGPAWAQEAPAEPIDYAAWESLAERAEETILAGRASSEALEDLRTELARWRTRFLRAQDLNEERIATIERQINTLGPAPEDPETEPDGIASRRTALNDQLAALDGPRRIADEAFTRAEGLIGEIDGIIRDRQADAMLRLGASPLNPAHWPPAVAAFTHTVRSIGTEVRTNWSSDARREAFRADLPRTLLLVLIAALLAVRGRRVMEAVTGLVFRRTGGRAATVAAFVVSLGQIIVPVLGLTLLNGALQSTGLLGIRGELVAGALPIFGLFLFTARWLAVRLFPYDQRGTVILDVTPARARRFRIASTALGLAIGLVIVLSLIADLENYSDDTSAVLVFPILLVSGLLVAWMGRIIVTMTLEGAGGAQERGLLQNSPGLLGRAAIALGLAGPAMGAVGYLNAAEHLVFPGAVSLGLIAFLVILHTLILDIFALVTGKSVEEARERLLPIIFSFGFVLASLPVFALIWGARPADLSEAWTQVRKGFTLGDITISPVSFLTFTAVFVAGYAVTRLLQGTLKTSILPKTHIDMGGQTAIVSGVGYVGIFLAALIAITSAGINLSSIAIVAGALSVGIGFGLQNIVQNFVSGIILLIERPIAEGDWIEVGPTMGIVKSISVRSTCIETFDKTEVIVPNGDFVSGTVTNWTRGNTMGRAIVTVGVAYGTDTRRVGAILEAIAHEHPLIALEPAPAVDFLGFGADALEFRIRAILTDVNFLLAVKTELHHRIAERFREEGIEIPFAQRDIWLRNPETLRGDSPPAAPPEPAPPAEASKPAPALRDMDLAETDGANSGEDGPSR